MQRHFLLPRPSCVITARLRKFRGWGTLQASLSVLNSISATRGFIATLKCLNKITLPFSELGFSCLKKKKKKGNVPVFFVLLIFPLFIQFLWGFFSSLKCFIVHGIFIKLILTAVIHNPQKPIFKAEAKKNEKIKKKNQPSRFSLISHFCVDY